LEPRAKKNRYKADRKIKRENAGRFFIHAGRGFLWFSGIALLSAGFILVHDLVTQWDYFNIRTIVVDGNRHLSKKAVLEQAQVETGKSLLAMNLNRARKRLLAHPWIVEATVKRQLPDTVEIRIDEETPLALVDLGSLFLINTKGEIFKKWSDTDPQDLPVIMGLDFSDIPTPGGPPGAAWESAVAVLKLGQRRNAMIPAPVIRSVHADPETGITLCLFEGGKAVRLGFGDLETKLAGLKQALFRLNLMESVADFDAIDVVETDRIVVIPVPDEFTSGTHREA